MKGRTRDYGNAQGSGIVYRKGQMREFIRKSYSFIHQHKYVYIQSADLLFRFFLIRLAEIQKHLENGCRDVAYSTCSYLPLARKCASLPFSHRNDMIQVVHLTKLLRSYFFFLLSHATLHFNTCIYYVLTDYFNIHVCNISTVHPVQSETIEKTVQNISSFEKKKKNMLSQLCHKGRQGLLY